MMMRLRPYLLLLLLLCARPVFAQHNRHLAEDPGFLRMCLWNADKSTWSQIGLKKQQVQLMQELKAKYPAVVDGQWVLDYQAPQRGLSDRGIVTTEDEPPMRAAPTGPGLVQELHQVLSEKQMHQWMILCKAVPDPRAPLRD